MAIYMICRKSFFSQKARRVVLSSIFVMLVSAWVTALALAQSPPVDGTVPPPAHAVPDDGSVLPFPTPPMAGKTAVRLQDSVMKWPKEKSHLPKDAPNIVIILIDDVGFGISDGFGGLVHTPTLDRLAKEGVSYNAFNTTSICSPTRAALLTGRNQTAVGSGTIAERAVAFDGYTGVMPKTAATIPEVLKNYGYHTAAFGKWHNTPAIETTSIGPKDHWPNAYGFENFYGFLGGETGQYEPRLFHNYNAIEPPHDPDYYLTGDLVKHALNWVDDERAFDPAKPFFIYFAPGAVHAPHQVFPEWSDKYKGKFAMGWDKYRQIVYKRQLKMGIIPPGTKLTSRPDTMESWASVPQSQRAFQERLMEVFAGFVQQTDTEIGKFLDGLKARGEMKNTIVFYIFGDNGSSAEGQDGSLSELLAQNAIPTTVAQQIAALDKIGGLSALGGPKVENIYNAGWAWAGDTPFKGTKLMASYFGGTRNPMVVYWPGHITPDGKMRSQFTHVIDIAPTIYKILDITPPEVVNGYKQIPINGTSLAYTFDDAAAKNRKKVQFFDNNGSRGVYDNGWFADTPGPFIPWDTADSTKRIQAWDSANDKWQLYNLNDDFSQANDLAQKNPQKLEAMKQKFLELAKENKDFPIGAGNWLRLHPEDRIKSPYNSWVFGPNTRRMPEFAAPGVGRQSTHVTVEADFGANSNGVLYAIGGAGGGLTVYMDDGHLVYDYNMLIVKDYKVRTADKVPAGKHEIAIDTKIGKPGGPGNVVISVDGKQAAKLTVDTTVPVAFSATETFDVGVDLGSAVSLSYADKSPFAFDGKIKQVRITQ